MRATHLLIAALLLGMTACTMVTTATPPEQDAEARLERAFGALEAGEYRTAFDHMAWVYSRCAGHERAMHALAGLAAIELDPRNRAGRPGVGSDMLGRLLTEPGQPAWLRPLAETSYLMALALGAPAGDGPVTAVDAAQSEADSAAAPRAEPADRQPDGIRVERAAAALDQAPGGPAHGCGRALAAEEDWLAPPLPTLPGPSLLSLLSELQASRDSASARAQTLSGELEALRQRLQETEQELERIRRTLRP